ncbi:SDR family oxidoreductase [Chryseosolibacter indicus]|uniref:SDR family oxidoreductase n=1 Tax=Chryseosolibacter indicus TaxID=2782351 RepID=A0ABS5VVK3_9BACT|nr:SDR family oxidoreductase [Chryseosolibacter indicus]MBT1705251.1 SDR family oxidoreductase [Chryseosolibacter indicus]
MRKLIVVTGGSKGIGRAIIEKFVINGFDAVTCSRNEDDLKQLKHDLLKLSPVGQTYTMQADMSNKADVKNFAQFILDLNRPIDVLVNNAGYFVPGAILTEPEGTLESMVDANLYSAYYMTRGIVSAIKKTPGAHIFNICSIASIKAYHNGGSYAITKSAMLGFSRCIREELKEQQVRVTAVMPGATKTRSWEGVDLPNDRFMKVEDVAEIVYATYSLSPQSVVEEILIRPQLGDI